jgi:hypothetical protein
MDLQSASLNRGLMTNASTEKVKEEAMPQNDLQERNNRRHKWAPLRTTYGSDEYICEHCRLEKIGRFDRGHHWVEWKRDGGYISSERTPVCR